jgi:hypothetical protein
MEARVAPPACQINEKCDYRPTQQQRGLASWDRLRFLFFADFDLRTQKQRVSVGLRHTEPQGAISIFE